MKISITARQIILFFLSVILNLYCLQAISAEGHNGKDKESTCPVSAIYDGFSRGDLEPAIMLMADNVRWIHPGDKNLIPFAGVFVSPDGVREFFNQAISSLENLGQKIDSCITQGNKTAVIGEESYRVVSTGKTYFTRWVHLYTIEKGLVTEFEEFADTAAIAEAFSGGE
jgi:hypothetical protein